MQMWFLLKSGFFTINIQSRKETVWHLGPCAKDNRAIKWSASAGLMQLMGERGGDMLDSIGREHGGAAAFVTVCECGQRMIASSLSGELVFNERGWGVHSYCHSRSCPVTDASRLNWQRIPLSGSEGSEVWADICRWFEGDDNDSFLAK